jgi:hypothetical protein
MVIEVAEDHRGDRGHREYRILWRGTEGLKGDMGL